MVPFVDVDAQYWCIEAEIQASIERDCNNGDLARMAVSENESMNG